MKKVCAIVLFVVIILTMFLLVGCRENAVVVDGIKLSKVKIVKNEVQSGTNSGDKWKTLKYSGVVENTTNKTLSFEVVYSYRGGDVFNMNSVSSKEKVTLSPGQTKSLSYTSEKTSSGIIDNKKIYIQNVKEEA